MESIHPAKAKRMYRCLKNYFISMLILVIAAKESNGQTNSDSTFKLKIKIDSTGINKFKNFNKDSTNKLLMKNLDSSYMNLKIDHKVDSVSGADILNPQRLISVQSSSIVYEGRVIGNSYYGQELPAYTQNIIVNPNVNVAGLQFKSSMTLSTDDIFNGRNINQFNISLARNDYNFRQNKFIDKSKSLTYKLDSLKNELSSTLNSYHNLNEKINNEEYEIKVKIAKQIQEKGLLDSNYNKYNTEKIKEANKFLGEYEKGLEQKKKYQTKINAVKDKMSKLEFIQKYSEENIKNPDELLNKKLSIKKEYSFKSFFTKPRRLEIMDVVPNFSPLVLNGIALRGGLIEFNKSNAYLSVTGGFVNSANWMDNIYLKSNSVISARVGYGNLDKNYVGLIYLKGYDNSNSIVNYKNKENDVIGIQFSYLLTENHKIQFEKAWSNQPNSEINQPLGDVVKTSYADYNNSSSFLAYNGYITKTKTNLEAKFRQDDLFYFSMGNPANRKDSYRLYLSLKQVFFRSKVNAQITYKKDADNVSNAKLGSIITHTYQGNLSYKLKKVTLRTDVQKSQTFNSYIGKQIIELNIVNVSGVLSNKIYGKLNTCVLLLNYIDNRIFLSDTKIRTLLINATNTTNINNTISMLAGLNASIRNSLDSSSSYRADLGVTVKKAKYSVSLKTSYQEIKYMEARTSQMANINYSVSKNINAFVQLGYDHFFFNNWQKSDFISLQFRGMFTF